MEAHRVKQEKPDYSDLNIKIVALSSDEKITSNAT